ncbi:MAG: WG repeat-containing protein [Clostridia bacterium]|nr:WG repeat-containing protein [Clostridia bacterium]
MRSVLRTRIKKTVQIVVWLALFAFFLLAAVLYQRGVYDIRNVSRVREQASSEEPGPVTEPATEPESSPGSEDSSASSSPDPATEPPTEEVPQTPPVPAVTAWSFTSSLPNPSDLSGSYRKLDSGIYSSETCVLARLKLTGLQNTFSLSEYEVRAIQVTEYEHGCIYSEEITETADRPVVLLRAGYLIRENKDGSFSLLSPDGNLLRDRYDESELMLTTLRDENGNLLFCSTKYVEEEVPVPVLAKDEYTGRMMPTGEYSGTTTETVPVHTYYTLGDDFKMHPSDYEDDKAASMDPGVVFDSPLDYGKTTCDLVRYFTGRYWGYKSISSGQIVVYPKYTKAYNFHDGYALAYDGNLMYVLNEKGEEIYSVGCVWPEVFWTKFELTVPDTNGLESLGTYYFSHGWTRVRVRENLDTYKLYYYIKDKDYTTLMDRNGNFFNLPAGYSLVGYSDGVLLLQQEESGLYGYMNYKGQWIAQPIYTYAHPFISGTAVLGTENACGMIDTSGTFIIPAQFDYVSDLSGGNVAVYDATTGWQVFQILTK